MSGTTTDRKIADIRAKRGVFLLGVLKPTALLAITVDIAPGELGGSYRRGVPAADGVPAKNRGCGGGALGIDCSSCISASGGSELGNLRGDDIARDCVF